MIPSFLSSESSALYHPISLFFPSVSSAIAVLLSPLLLDVLSFSFTSLCPSTVPSVFSLTLSLCHLSPICPASSPRGGRCLLISLLLSHLSVMSSTLGPLNVGKPWLLGDAGAEAWPLAFCKECLLLRLLSRPLLSGGPPTLARRRSLRPEGGGWLSSSPSSCRRVI